MSTRLSYPMTRILEAIPQSFCTFIPTARDLKDNVGKVGYLSSIGKVTSWAIHSPWVLMLIYLPKGAVVSDALCNELNPICRPHRPWASRRAAALLCALWENWDLQKEGRKKYNPMRGRARSWRLETSAVVEEPLMDQQFLKPIAFPILSRPRFRLRLSLTVTYLAYLALTVLARFALIFLVYQRYCRDLQWENTSEREETPLSLSRKARSMPWPIPTCCAARFQHQNTDVRTQRSMAPLWKSMTGCGD